MIPLIILVSFTILKVFAGTEPWVEKVDSSVSKLPIYHLPDAVVGVDYSHEIPLRYSPKL